MKKTKVAFPVCALMALALCATPITALANETSGRAFGEEEIAFVGESLQPEEQYVEAMPQDEQVPAEGEDELESVMQEEDDAEDVGQGNVQGNGQDDGQGDATKTIVSCELKGKVRVHFVGEELDLSGLHWLVTYDDGSTSTVDVDPNGISGFEPGRAGVQPVACRQDIGDTEWIRYFSIYVMHNMSDSLVAYGNVVGGIDLNPTAGMLSVQKLNGGKDAISDRDVRIARDASDENLEQRYCDKKDRSIKSQKMQLFVPGARVPETAFSIGIDYDNPITSGLISDNDAERIEGGARLLVRPITGKGYEVLADAS